MCIELLLIFACWFCKDCLFVLLIHCLAWKHFMHNSLTKQSLPFISLSLFLPLSLSPSHHSLSPVSVYPQTHNPCEHSFIFSQLDPPPQSIYLSLTHTPCGTQGVLSPYPKVSVVPFHPDILSPKNDYVSKNSKPQNCYGQLAVCVWVALVLS